MTGPLMMIQTPLTVHAGAEGTYANRALRMNEICGLKEVASSLLLSRRSQLSRRRGPAGRPVEQSDAPVPLFYFHGARSGPL